MEPKGSLPCSYKSPLIPIHAHISCFFETDFNIILPPTSKFQKCLFPSNPQTQILYAFNTVHYKRDSKRSD